MGHIGEGRLEIVRLLVGFECGRGVAGADLVSELQMGLAAVESGLLTDSGIGVAQIGLEQPDGLSQVTRPHGFQPPTEPLITQQGKELPQKHKFRPVNDLKW